MFPDERQPVFSEFESYMMAGGLRKFYLEISETNLCIIFIKIYFSVLTQNWKLGILTWLTSLFLSRSLPFSSFSSRTQLSGKVFFSTNKTFFLIWLKMSLPPQMWYFELKNVTSQALFQLRGPSASQDPVETETHPQLQLPLPLHWTVGVAGRNVEIDFLRRN